MHAGSGKAPHGTVVSTSIPHSREKVVQDLLCILSLAPPKRLQRMVWAFVEAGWLCKIAKQAGCCDLGWCLGQRDAVTGWHSCGGGNCVPERLISC